MTVDNLIGLVLAIVLAAYLIGVLIYPEKL